MKATSLLLAASLAANAALLAAFVLRSPSSSAHQVATTSQPKGTTASSARDAELRAALESGDRAALQAMGISADVARELALGRAFSRIAEKVRAARATENPDERWWRQPNAGGSRELSLQLRREVSDAMIAAFGEDLSTLNGGGGTLAFLSPEKRDALRRIGQDYDEMMAKYGAGGIQLASDREKLRLLRAERDRDIAALLTPEERQAYEMRTSPSAAVVRSRYGDALQSEDDFQKIYALQKAFDDKFPRDAGAAANFQQRSVAERQLQDDIRVALGEDKFAALRRASDPDLRNVESLATRLALPPNTTDRVAAARETFAAESQRINADTTLNPPQRRAKIQELGTQAKSEVASILGGEATDAYAQRSTWLNMLQGGVAYSTTPPPSGALAGPATASVFPVMPGGGAGVGAQRQVIVSGGPAIEVGGGGGDLFFAPAGAPPAVRDTVQVMTFSTSGGAGDGHGTTEIPVEKRIVVPVNPPPPKQ